VFAEQHELMFRYPAAVVKPSCRVGVQVAVLRHPLQHGAPLWSAARIMYLVLLGIYWAWNLVHLVADLKSLAEVGALGALPAGCPTAGCLWPERIHCNNRDGRWYYRLGMWAAWRS